MTPKTNRVPRSFSLKWPLCVLTCLALDLATPKAHAYSFMHTDGGRRLQLSPYNRWTGGPYLPLSGNVRNESNITSEELQAAVVAGLQAWQQATDYAFSFDYWQGDDPDVYGFGMRRDGLSTVFFASQDPAGSGLSPSQSAYTRVYFDAESGDIDEVDIVLNDVDVRFTTDPTGALEIDDGSSRPIVVLQDVVAHEIGHALGIGHSGVLDSTMFAYGWKGQSDLSCDDVAAVRSLYGGGERLGSLSGRVLAPNGEPVFGAHVVAIDLSIPAVAASAFTGRKGSYLMEALAEGKYVLMVEPYGSGPDSLDDIYASMDPDAACEGKPFSRTFLDDGGELAIAKVSANETQNVGDTMVSCSGVYPALEADAMELPPLSGGEQFVKLLLTQPGAEQNFYVETTGGPLDVTFMSYSLFSPARVIPELLASDGVRYETTNDPSFASFDARLTTTSLPAGVHDVSFATELLPDTAYPMGRTFLDEEAFVLLIGRTDDQEATTCSPIVTNVAYTSPDGPPRRRYVDDDGFIGACAFGFSRPARPLPLVGVLLGLVAFWRRRRARNALFPRPGSTA